MEFSGEHLAALGQSIERLISSRTVIGDPIKVGDITLVPVVDVLFGIGSGSGGGTALAPSSPATGRPGNQSEGGGSGFATGARVSPRALIVVKPGQVEVYPLNATTPIERILDRLPSLTGTILDKIREGTGINEPGDWQ